MRACRAGPWWLDAGGAVSIWVSLSSAPARLTFSPSTSPSQPSRSASPMRSCRLARISSRRARWAGSGRRSEHLTQACSWMHGVPKARAQMPMDTLRFSKWREELRPIPPRSGCGIPRWARAARRRAMNARWASMASSRVDGLIAHRGADVAVAGDDLGDVRRKPVHDRVGDEDPSEVVGGVTQRMAVGGVGQPGARPAPRRACSRPAGLADRAGARSEPAAGTAAAMAAARCARAVVGAAPAALSPSRPRIRRMMALSTSASSGRHEHSLN